MARLANKDVQQNMDNNEKKTWPAFAKWISGLGHAIEKSDPSKVLGLTSGIYIIATPIGNLGDITMRALWALQQVDAILCEDTRVSGKLLACYGIKKPLISCHDHNEASRSKDVLNRLAQGQSLALISDAGTPLIADPGYKLVRACHEAGHPVTALPGASALLTALATAGLPTDRFLFVGFLPAKKTARRKEIEALSAMKATLVFYESPQRLAATLNDMIELLDPSRRAVIARELTKLYEETREGTLAELATHYKEAPKPKGEIVLLLEPAKNIVIAWEDILKKSLESMSLRDAVTVTTQATGAPKKAVYQKALEITQKN